VIEVSSGMHINVFRMVFILVVSFLFLVSLVYTGNKRRSFEKIRNRRLRGFHGYEQNLQTTRLPLLKEEIEV